MLKGGIILNDIELWNAFLENMKEVMAPFTFNTWFNEEDTKFYSYVDNVITIVCPETMTKNHIEKYYLDMMQDAINKIVDGVTFRIILEEDVKKIEKEKKDSLSTQVDLDNVKQSSYNANLKQEYTFDNFVVGNSNKFAYKTACAVASMPGEYNPFFLYGESGVGKTHLMHAIGNYIVNNTDKKVLYVSSETFVNDYVRTFGYNNKNNFEKVDSFKEKYRNVDILMVDDIQYLGNAQKGQEEFFHTFNELYNAKKQIIIASDRPADELNSMSIENRLLTRLNWGLNANITTPDYDLRVGIIRNKLAYKEIEKEIPDEVIEYIANNYDSDIRKLEGAITRVLAYSSMINRGEINLDVAIEALKDQLKDRSFYKNDIQRIQKVVCEYYKISLDQMKGKKKNDSVNFPRQVAIYLCRELTTESYPKIGSYFGGRNHSTIISAYNKIKKEIEVNENLKNVIINLKKNLT